MTNDCRRSLQVQASPDCLDQIHDLIDLVAAEAAMPSDVVVRLTTAAMEIVDNVVEHGATTGPVDLRVTVEVTGGWFRAIVEDDGPPAPIDPGAIAMPDELEDHGRGLPLAARLLDVFQYERVGDGNNWHLGVAIND